MEKTLKQFVPGETGTVLRITVEGALRRRLFDMGITPGAQITMRKTAPLGDPIEIKVRGYELSIRKAEAESIIMNLSQANCCGKTPQPLPHTAKGGKKS